MLLEISNAQKSPENVSFPKRKDNEKGSSKVEHGKTSASVKYMADAPHLLPTEMANGSHPR